MPPADLTLSTRPLLRTFIYGMDKTQKTWWALKCAEYGYNTVLFNIDDGAQIVKQIETEARKKIFILDLVDGLFKPVSSIFLPMFLRERNKFTWDEQEKKYSLNIPNDHSSVVVEASKLTSNDVLVIDSWTSYQTSTLMVYAQENGIDLSEADKTEWPGYGFQKRLLDWTLDKLHALPCHLIVVGHATAEEKRDAKGKLLSSFTLPVSSSIPHAKTLTKHFNDVLFFRRVSATFTQIDASSAADRAGGSRNLPPKTYRWEELPPQKLFEAVGATPPNGAPLEAFKYFAPGQTPEMAKPIIGPSADNAQDVKTNVAAIGTGEVKKAAFTLKGLKK